jgi:hypothetical protein
MGQATPNWSKGLYECTARQREFAAEVREHVHNHLLVVMAKAEDLYQAKQARGKVADTIPLSVDDSDTDDSDIDEDGFVAGNYAVVAQDTDTRGSDSEEEGTFSSGFQAALVRRNGSNSSSSGDGRSGGGCSRSGNSSSSSSSSGKEQSMSSMFLNYYGFKKATEAELGVLSLSDIDLPNCVSEASSRNFDHRRANVNKTGKNSVDGGKRDSVYVQDAGTSGSVGDAGFLSSCIRSQMYLEYITPHQDAADAALLAAASELEQERQRSVEANASSPRNRADSPSDWGVLQSAPTLEMNTANTSANASSVTAASTMGSGQATPPGGASHRRTSLGIDFISMERAWELRQHVADAVGHSTRSSIPTIPLPRRPLNQLNCIMRPTPITTVVMEKEEEIITKTT